MCPDFQNAPWLEVSNQMIQGASVTRIDAAVNFAPAKCLSNPGMIFAEGRADHGVVHGGCQVNIGHVPQICIVKFQRGLEPPPGSVIEIIPHRPSKRGRDQAYDRSEIHHRSLGPRAG